jgi:hypothetical protein
MTHDVPLHLRAVGNPAEYLAARDEGTDWAAECARANRRATFNATEAEREQIREFGLVIGRKPANLGEHHLGDQLGREVLSELARR